MTIIINTSNLYAGGGVQVGLSFINELKALDRPHQYHIFLSRAVEDQIDQTSFSDERFRFYSIEHSPAGLLKRRKIVKQLDVLESEIDPDVIFTVFGPSYWTPKSPHVMGFAVPWVLRPDTVAYKQLDFLEALKARLLTAHVAYYAKRNASDYIIETNDGKTRLSAVLGIEEDKISVVGNSHSAIFNDSQFLLPENEFYMKLPEKEEGEFRLILISFNHPNKNLRIINEVIPYLSGVNVKFILTIDDESFQTLYSEESQRYIMNLGPVKQKSCPSLYTQSDAMFLPTLLEVFSASYPEAMKMRKPILTSNYSFAEDVCGDAALYFDPLDPKDIAEKIKELSDNKALQMDLVAKGEARLKEFETARTRAEKYLNICEKIGR